MVRPAPARRTALVIAVMTVLGLALRLYQVTRPHQLTGVGIYDDGVYVGGSIQLTHGQLPYHDFVFVHPPLILLALSPITVWSHVVGTQTVFAAARVFTVLVSTATIPVAGLLVRHRGAVATAVLCGVLAVHHSSVRAGHFVVMEPFLTLFVAGALVAVFDGDRVTNSSRRLVVAGVLLGLACSMKLWAVVPALVIVAIAARRPAAAARVAGGLVAAFAVVTAPFALTAPRSFWREVVISQLERGGVRTPVTYRVANLLGVDGVATLGRHLVPLVVGGAVVLFVAWTIVLRRQGWRPTQLELVAGVGAVLVGAMFLLGPQYYWHYGAFFAPFLALVVALPAGVLADGVSVPALRIVTAAAVVVFAAGLLLGLRCELRQRGGDPAPPAALARAIPSGACVVSNHMSVQIVIDRVVAASRCPVVIDGFGADLALSGGQQRRGAFDRPAVRSFWHTTVAQAQYLVLSRRQLRNMPWRRLQPYVRRHFHRVPMPGTTMLFARRH